METDEYKNVNEDQGDQSDAYSILANDRSSESECESNCHIERDDSSLNSFGMNDEELSPQQDRYDPQEGTSGMGGRQISRCKMDAIEHRDSDQTDDETDKNIKLKDLDNYLKNFGPKLERCENKLDEFTHQLQIMRPHLEKCENSLERYGQQLRAIERQLDNVQASEDVVQSSQTLETQTVGGEEFAAIPEAAPCQGPSFSNGNQQYSRPQSQSSSNTRRLSRRPSFQVNDGLIRHCIRRRNDQRDMAPFNRYREERRRHFWRYENDMREFRRLRATWRFHQVRQQALDTEDRGVYSRFGRYNRDQNADEAHRRNEGEQGFVLLENVHQAGGSGSFAPQLDELPSQRARRPRSNMSLRSIDMYNCPIRRSESNLETDEETMRNINDRVGFDGGSGGHIIRSWIMMNNFFQSRPLFFGQGDSKYMNGQFTVNRVPPFEHPLRNGNERHDNPEQRDQRPVSRNQRRHHQ